MEGPSFVFHLERRAAWLAAYAETLRLRQRGVGIGKNMHSWVIAVYLSESILFRLTLMFRKEGFHRFGIVWSRFFENKCRAPNVEGSSVVTLNCSGEGRELIKPGIRGWLLVIWHIFALFRVRRIFIWFTAPFRGACARHHTEVNKLEPYLNQWIEGMISKSTNLRHLVKIWERRLKQQLQ